MSEPISKALWYQTSSSNVVVVSRSPPSVEVCNLASLIYSDSKLTITPIYSCSYICILILLLTPILNMFLFV